LESAAYSAIGEHLQKPHNAGSRPQARFFNTLLGQQSSPTRIPAPAKTFDVPGQPLVFEDLADHLDSHARAFTLKIADGKFVQHAGNGIPDDFRFGPAPFRRRTDTLLELSVCFAEHEQDDTALSTSACSLKVLSL